MGLKRKITKNQHKEMSIEDAFERFIDEKKSLNRSSATIKSSQGTFKVWHTFLVENDMVLNIYSVDDNYIRSFTKHCLAKQMKPTTLNHYLRELRSFLYWCMEQRLLEKKFKIKMVTEQEVIKETYSEEELQLLLAKPSKKATFVEWRAWAVVNWILATGNRASTICNIKIGDLNYSRSEIYIRKTKTNKAMILPFSNTLKQVIKEYTKIWRVMADEDDYLFPSIGDEMMNVDSLKHSIRRFNLDRGVNRTSIHAFRHTFAKHWIINTGDAFRLQKILGHSSLEMTRRYVNMFSEDLKEDFENYNPLDRIRHSASRTQKIKRN